MASAVLLQVLAPDAMAQGVASRPAPPPPAPPREALSAFEALANLPPGQRANLARIEGRDGAPSPERWHLLVHDPASANGLREFVIAGRKIAAVRTLSQFVVSLEARDTLGKGDLEIDSDQAAQVARGFAVANSIQPAAFNFTLAQNPNTNSPAWTVSCLDADGIARGSITLNAITGAVIASEGFPITPALTRASSRTPATPGVAATNQGERRGSSRRAAAPRPRNTAGQQ